MLVVFFQGEDVLGGLAEVARNLQDQDAGGDVAAGFYGVDGLSAHTYGGGQFLLGDVFDRPFYFNRVFHFTSLLMDFIVKLNFRIYTRKYR